MSSKVTVALEEAVAVVIANTPADGSRGTARQRATVDREFARILKLIAPRIRHFVRQYGLISHWDDAEQCCAIAVHRAIQAYEPDKAQFTTFVNWQIRGELQSLRFRLMTDQRPSAKKVEATTVSLHNVTTGAEGEESSLEAMLEDEGALERTEAGAADYLARSATASLIDELMHQHRTAAVEQLRRNQPKRALAKARAEGPRLKSALIGIDPAEIAALEERLDRERKVLERRVFGDEADAAAEDVAPELSKDRVRQIGKRASRLMAELAAVHPRFQVMADTLTTVPVPAHVARGQAKVALVADAGRASAGEAGGPAPRPARERPGSLAA